MLAAAASISLDRALGKVGTGRAEVLAAVKAAVPVSAADTVLLTGSLAAGVGNSRSDVDIYVLRSKSLGSEAPNRIVSSGTALVDIKVWDPSECDVAERTLQDALTGDFRDALNVPYGVLDFVYRVGVGLLLAGDSKPSNGRRAILLESQREVLLRQGLTGIDAAQIDLIGALESGEGLTAAHLLRNLLGHMAQILYAASRGLDPNAKWHWQHMARMASKGELLRPYIDIEPALLPRLLFELALVAEPTVARVREHASTAVEVASWLVPWCQSAAAGEQRPALPFPKVGEEVPTAGGAFARSLQLDTTVRLVSGQLLVRGLCREVELVISKAAHRQLCSRNSRSAAGVGEALARDERRCEVHETAWHPSFLDALDYLDFLQPPPACR